MPENAHVRALHEDDAHAMLSLMLHLAVETPYTLLSEEENRATASIQQSRTVELVQSPHQQVYVADNGQALVGFIALSRGVFSKIRHVASLVMGVQKAYWGYGVAEHLIQHGLAWADQGGILRIELSTAIDNQRALHFYQRHGFVKEGIKRASLRQAEGLTDEIMMARLQKID